MSDEADGALPTAEHALGGPGDIVTAVDRSDYTLLELQ
jgi:hypothetical protein